MRTVKLSLISWSGQVVNVWSVPYARHKAALEVAMQRAEDEGHAGVFWASFSGGKTKNFVFDSHDPLAMLMMERVLKSYMKDGKLDVDRFLGRQGGVKRAAIN
ncbi:hypothetical protein [Paenibacillus herberti]|uniref:Uncharacterized protein n=1 Tax=Paenibacillus herberti TaxID=1619309 RepID=A0A229P0D0_9BACL|nr:hypothetical protein [Paenibacillus herberti]OXM15444.1 hypothetical protein CGZ75_01505 [Paenibacillus herberti]